MLEYPPPVNVEYHPESMAGGWVYCEGGAPYAPLGLPVYWGGAPPYGEAGDATEDDAPYAADEGAPYAAEGEEAADAAEEDATELEAMEEEAAADEEDAGTIEDPMTCCAAAPPASKRPIAKDIMMFKMENERSRKC